MASIAMSAVFSTPAVLTISPSLVNARLICMYGPTCRTAPTRRSGIVSIATSMFWPPEFRGTKEPTGELEWRLAHHAAEYSVEVERRQAGFRRDRLEIERVVEASRDQLDGPLNCLLIVRERLRLH